MTTNATTQDKPKFGFTDADLAALPTVYAPGLSPMDVHAVSEARVDGAWGVACPVDEGEEAGERQLDQLAAADHPRGRLRHPLRIGDDDRGDVVPPCRTACAQLFFLMMTRWFVAFLS